MNAADKRTRCHFFREVSDGRVRMIGGGNVIERQKHPGDDLRQKEIEQSRSKHVGKTGAAGDRFVKHSTKRRRLEVLSPVSSAGPAIDPGIECSRFSWLGGHG